MKAAISLGQEKVKVKAIMKKTMVPSLLFFGISLFPLTVQAESVYQVSGDQGQDTPEECIQYFAACLSENDLEGAVEAFAVDHYIDRTDFTAQMDRFKVWAYNQEIPLSPDNALSRQLDKAAMREEITEDIRIFCLSLGLDIEWRSTQEIEDTEAFLETLELKDLSSLEVERLIYAEVETQDNEKYQESMKKLWEIHDCDRMEDYYVIYTLQDDFYIGSAQFIEYDGQWYLRSLYSTLSGLTSPEVMKLSAQQYEQVLEELEGKK